MVIDGATTSAASFSPLLTTMGFGGVIGFLIGFVLKKLMKILAIIAGVFLAALMYLSQQGIVNVNWDKFNVTYHDVLSSLLNTINGTTSEGGTVTSHIFPMMTNLGVPLTGSTAVGFTIGILKG